MQFSTVLSMLTLVFSLAFAAPTSTNVTNTTVTNTTITPPNRYHLQTKVVGAYCPDKDGLYVSGYHTGMDSKSSANAI